MQDPKLKAMGLCTHAVALHLVWTETNDWELDPVMIERYGLVPHTEKRVLHLEACTSVVP